MISIQAYSSTQGWVNCDSVSTAANLAYLSKGDSEQGFALVQIWAGEPLFGNLIAYVNDDVCPSKEVVFYIELSELR